MGEGLQHQDGHSLVLASTIPAVQAYDPAFAYEVAAIVQAGLQRMYGGAGGDPDVFYYLALYNENYVMPAAARRPRVGQRHHARPVPVRAAHLPPASRPRCCSAVRRSAPPRQPPPPCATATTSASNCGRPPRTRRCAKTRWPPSAGTACTPSQPARTPMVAELLAPHCRADRGGHRLHEDRARTGRPVAARPHVHAARHRRHGSLRHPRGAAPVLRDRRGPRGRRRVGCARRTWRDRRRCREQGDRRVRHRPRRRSTPTSSDRAPRDGGVSSTSRSRR